jgi:hypothetical protein
MNDYSNIPLRGLLMSDNERLQQMYQARQNMAPLGGLGMAGLAAMNMYAGSPMYVPFQLQPLTTLEERNEAKRQRAIEWLGTRWILHPENQVRRIGDV